MAQRPWKRGIRPASGCECETDGIFPDRSAQAASCMNAHIRAGFELETVEVPLTV